jgi:hypothetical protein
VGIAVGAAAVAVLVTVGIFLLMRRKRKMAAQKPTSPPAVSGKPELDGAATAQGTAVAEVKAQDEKEVAEAELNAVPSAAVTPEADGTATRGNVFEVSNDKGPANAGAELSAENARHELSQGIGRPQGIAELHGGDVKPMP